MQDCSIVDELYEVVSGRRENPVDGSYTNYLFAKGREKICKKLGEEAVEVILAAAASKREDTVEEIADLTYHILVLMADMGITPGDVDTALRARR